MNDFLNLKNKTRLISNADGLSLNHPLTAILIKEMKNSAIFTIDRERRIHSWNRVSETLFRYSEEEIVGENLDLLFSEAFSKQENRQFVDTALRNGRNETEIWCVKKGKELFLSSLIINSIKEESGKYSGFLCIVQDLTEKKKNEEALYKKNENLIKSRADLVNFIYTAAHDLKSPVNNMEGLMNYIQPGMEPEKLSQMLEFLNLSIDKLKITISDLSQFSTVDTEAEKGQVEIISIPQVLKEVKFHFHVHRGEDFPTIETDLQVDRMLFSRLNIKSIFINLITNAAMSRSPERECIVKVSTYLEGNRLIIEVADNRKGMPEGYEQRLFKMLSKMQKNLTVAETGLYIMKRIVDNAEGTLEVFSEEGKGTTFKISLPRLLQETV